MESKISYERRTYGSRMTFQG